LEILVAVMVGFWALAAYPGRVLWGESALVFSAVALVLCLVPAAITLLWAGWAFRQSPEQQLVAVLGGTGLRMAFVLALGLGLYLSVPYFSQSSFWLWILGFYLMSLALEVGLIVAGQPINTK
jgi:hypothetical protein